MIKLQKTQKENSHRITNKGKEKKIGRQAINGKQKEKPSNRPRHNLLIKSKPIYKHEVKPDKKTIDE